MHTYMVNTMKIGYKIKKLRELKGFSQENMADELKISVTGYGKIERDEVNVNLERLASIAQILGMNIEDILAFNEQVVFNNYSEKVSQQYANQVKQQIGIYNIPVEMEHLYKTNIKLLEENNRLLQEKIQTLEKK